MTNYFICADCGADLSSGVSGQIGVGKKARLYCLKHYGQRHTPTKVREIAQGATRATEIKNKGV